MENKQLVSVVVPIYNTELYLPRCIDSICEQTYQNLEIILVDDGSPDGCGLICDEYALKDHRIKVIHKENGGLSSARNAGIEDASGEFISFIDSDDFIKPEMYQKMVDTLNVYDADVCLCRCITFDETNQYGTSSISSSEDDVILSGKEMQEKLVKDGAPKYVIACNKLIRRRVYQQLRFVADKQHEDEFFAHHLYGLCDKAVMIDSIFYVYQIRANSIMHKTISEKRLDVVDALIDRVQYYRTHHADDLALWTLFDAIDQLSSLCTLISKNKQTSKRISGLRITLRQMGADIPSSVVLSHKQKAKLLTLRIFPVYISLRRALRIIRK